MPKVLICSASLIFLLDKDYLRYEFLRLANDVELMLFCNCRSSSMASKWLCLTAAFRNNRRYFSRLVGWLETTKNRRIAYMEGCHKQRSGKENLLRLCLWTARKSSSLPCMSVLLLPRPCRDAKLQLFHYLSIFMQCCDTKIHHASVIEVFLVRLLNFPTLFELKSNDTSNVPYVVERRPPKLSLLVQDRRTAIFDCCNLAISWVNWLFNKSGY